jgi:hypothetical protein
MAVFYCSWSINVPFHDVQTMISFKWPTNWAKDDEPRPPLHLLGPTFPELRSLHLEYAHLGSGSLFASLHSCHHLTALTLDSCECDDTVTAAALLGQLTGLRSLVLAATTPLRLASKVSTLTSLWLGVEPGEEMFSNSTLTAQELVSTAAHNPQLQSLRATSLVPSPTAQDLQLLLTSLPFLTSLSLGTTLQADHVLTLLRHGTHITSLTVDSMEVKRSLAPEACSWKSLTISMSFPNVLTLANLPLDSIEELSLPYQQARLELPLTTVPTPQVPALLHKAAAVIARTQSCDWLCLTGTDDRGPVQPHFGPATRLQLLQALAPLRHAGLRSFSLDGFSCEFEMGAPEVEALSTSIGNHLKSMSVGSMGRVTLSTTFWPVLRSHFPALNWVSPGRHACGAVNTADHILEGCTSPVDPAPTQQHV